jgi:hypothetical protein
MGLSPCCVELGGVQEGIRKGVDEALKADGGVVIHGQYYQVMTGIAPDFGGEEGVGRAVAGKITGFTKHGINMAISKDGVGVSSRAILDAVKNPMRTVEQAKGAIGYVGKNATAVLNEAGEVITTWARNSSGWRIPP